MTAEACLKEGNEGYDIRTILDNLTDEQIIDCMVDFAKYHVTEALKEASKNVVLEIFSDNPKHWNYPLHSYTSKNQINVDGVWYVKVEKDSILSSYPLTKIK